VVQLLLLVLALLLQSLRSWRARIALQPCLLQRFVRCVSRFVAQKLAQLFVVNGSRFVLVVVTENHLQIIGLRACGQDNSKLLHGSFELVAGNRSSILNVEKLESLLEKKRLFLGRRALLV